MGRQEDDVDKLVSDVQVAHRLVVGFYQRLLPALDELAGSVQCDFWYWEPMWTARPPAAATRPTKKWLWDMVPLFASTHGYKRAGGGAMQLGDLALIFDIEIDESFSPDGRKTAGMRGNPDAILLPIGHATFNLSAYRAVGGSEHTFETVWNDAREPEETGWQRVHGTEPMEGQRWSMGLAEFVRDSSVLAKQVQAACAAPLG